ncbi:long-chain-alcohol oxidase FAO4A [Physcomitrium patens]|uniref:Long-chain-alcohol oxidase n=1 Tax=Physcomitrium patens TaxID=3218 RepID=A0A2K1JIQ0_PHYPA|nr:long-chain-alcohol oxidase FAO4A-like [Physcomitrium patens]PNR41196.1 hypothetical protein PHYPA_018599 [Physcomitrium patens]|eukprot:XP_024394337.1 long-chain-alcohol oxidase FAO4A-like [Physcomitrella patens]
MGIGNGAGIDEKKIAKLVLHAHPSLLRWAPPCKHNFTPAQFEALKAVCDTIVPSLPPPFKDGEAFELMRGVTAEDVARFYEANASDEGVAEVVAASLEVLVRPVVLKTMLQVLSLLSTGWGTALLAVVGRVNILTFKYPVFRKFSRLPLRDQEKVLRGWSTSPLPQFRLLFKAFKSVGGWAFYSKVNEYGYNVSWKAIGYPGVAPEVRNRTEADYKQPRPLGDAHVDAKEAGAGLKSILASKGFVVEEVESFRSQSEKLGFSKNDNDVYLQCDAVVVGSGSGGGVMAAALAKQGFKVVVLEKGQYFAAQDMSTLEGPTLLNMFEKMGAMATDDGGVALIAGKSVGGGTTINWSVSLKTPQNVRDEWANEHGLDMFNSERYDKATQAVCDRISVQPNVDKHSIQNIILREGCKKLGYHHGTLSRNCASDHYCGWCTYGCPTGKKQSTAQTWLVDAVNTGNALILSNCTADYVFHGANPGGVKGSKAQGVAATIVGGPNRVYIKANATVVSCGALMTPVLLLKSGLKNPNIGKYLRLHPASTCYGYFPEGTGPEGRPYEGGIMTEYAPVNFRKPTEYGGLLETGVFHPGAFSAFHAWGSGADNKERLLRHGRTSHITVVVRDKGFGTVEIDKGRNPKISYKMSKYDQETTVAGMVQSLRVLVAAGAVEVGSQQLGAERFNAKGASPSDIEAYLNRVERRGASETTAQIISAHQLGSCRMGTSPSTSAADPRGEIWEVEGLFVGDGSVLPTAPGVNPMVTIQSVAFCTAEHIVQYLNKFKI